MDATVKLFDPVVNTQRKTGDRVSQIIASDCGKREHFTQGYDPSELRRLIQAWARELGFTKMGVSDVDLREHESHLNKWLDSGYHGDMQWMAAHGTKRSRPEELVPGTIRVISVRMDYKPSGADPELQLEQPGKAYIARYTLGRDYHKLMRKRLAKLSRRIEAHVCDGERAEGTLGRGKYRAFVDSAPVLERALAQRAGLGWIGKNSMLISKEAGSWFFLGEIFTNLPLAVDDAHEAEHCGTCVKCLDVCPTRALIAPGILDARRCVSYLTIEHKGSIDPELRPLMGNRIFGCDDCQLYCPWTKFSPTTAEADFQPRHGLDDQRLVDLFLWDELTWARKTEGSALRRIGYERWLRNLAVALGNAPTDPDVIGALRARADDSSELVREHIAWALKQHTDPSRHRDKSQVRDRKCAR
ncbi:MAG: tRNA epoxyqueuosine(34) reductase QueG [Pseudomonadota bacterium]